MRKTHKLLIWILSATTIVALSIAVDSSAAADERDDVVGCGVDDAASYLVRLGHKVHPSGKDVGVVLSTGLTDGEYEPIVLYVGEPTKDLAPCSIARVPKLIGDSEQAAIDDVRGAGFVLQVDTSRLPKGERVAEQKPEANSIELKKTTHIIVWAPTPTPTTTEAPTTTIPTTTEVPTTEAPTTTKATPPPTTASTTTRTTTGSTPTSTTVAKTTTSSTAARKPSTTRTTRAADTSIGARTTASSSATTPPSSLVTSSLPPTTTPQSTTSISPTSTSGTTTTTTVATAPRTRGQRGGHLTLTGPVAGLTLATALGLVGVHRARTTRSALRSQLDAHLTRDSDLHVSGGDLGLVAWLDPPEITTLNKEFPS